MILTTRPCVLSCQAQRLVYGLRSIGEVAEDNDIDPVFHCVKLKAKTMCMDSGVGVGEVNQAD